MNALNTIESPPIAHTSHPSVSKQGLVISVSFIHLCISLRTCAFNHVNTCHSIRLHSPNKFINPWECGTKVTFWRPLNVQSIGKCVRFFYVSHVLWDKTLGDTQISVTRKIWSDSWPTECVFRLSHAVKVVFLSELLLKCIYKLCTMQWYTWCELKVIGSQLHDPLPEAVRYPPSGVSDLLTFLSIFSCQL
jgi:hypothetical protein